MREAERDRESQKMRMKKKEKRGAEGKMKIPPKVSPLRADLELLGIGGARLERDLK